MKHHALLFVGDRDMLLRKISETHPAGTDIEHIVADTLGIDTVRSLQRHAIRRPLVREKRCFVLSCGSLTHEAQNGLLKLLEDPPRAAEFALIVSSREILLPTLRSRLQEEYVATTPPEALEAEQFLKSTPKERLSLVEQGLKDKERARAWAEALVMNLASLSHNGESSVATLRALTDAVGHITRSGSSPKMILEHLALTLPKT